MQDIFDQASGAAPKPSGGSDIFDQAAQPDTKPAAAAAAPAAPARPAGLPDGVDLPGLPSHAPAPDMQKPGVLDYLPKGATDALSAKSAMQGKDALETNKETGDQLLHGPKTLAEGLGGVFDPREGSSSGVVTRSGYRAPTPEAVHNDQGHALAQVVGGAGETMLTADAPEMAKTGLTALLPGPERAAAIKGAAKIIAGFASGTVAEHVADKAAEKLGFTSGARELTDALAFFVPSVAGDMLGLKTAAGTADGKTGAGASVLGGKASAGAYASPEEFGAGVRVGDTQFNVRVPRKPPTDAATITGQQLLDQGVETMKDGQAADAAAEAIVNGATPQQAVDAQKPQKPMPAGMEKGELTPATVGTIAQAIKLLPEEDRAQAVMEAHGNLAGWMAKQGKFVGPDGQITVVKTPEQAQQLAAKLINDKIAEHDKAAADAQQPTAEEKGKSKLRKGADDQTFQRAKTLLDSNPKHGDPVNLLQRNLQVPAAEAAALVRRYVSDKAANVGSAAERVVEEKPATIDAQMDALRAGTIKAVMLPEGSNYEPTLGPGMKKVVVDGDAPGAGTYIIKGISPQTVKEAAKAGTHGDLLGHVQTKEELAGGPTVAVVASKPDGTEIQASEVNNPQAAQAQAEVLAERHPDAHIDIKPIDDVIHQRLEPESGDVFDQAAKPAPKAAPKAAPEPKDEQSTPEKTPAKAVPAAYIPGDRIAGHDGKQTAIETPDETLPARYRLVDLKDVTPSHDGITFHPNGSYPGKGNERNYETEAGKDKVINQHQRFNRKFLVNNNPDAVNGPPIIYPDGVVPGGNSRVMTLQRLAKGLPQTTKKDGSAADTWKDYRDALKENAATFGYTPEQVDAMPNAALVREIAAPKSMDEFDRHISTLNKSHTAPLSPTEKAVSAGRKITPETMNELSRLIDSTRVPEGKTPSIRNMLADHGGEAVGLMEKTGAITDLERKSFLDTDGTLSDAGKAFIEDAMLGHVVDDSKLMDAVPRVILNKLDGALSAVVNMAAEADEWNLIGSLRKALHQHADAAARGSTIETYLGQTGMFATREINPVVDAIARKLAERPAQVKLAMREFAQEAKEARIGQGAMFGTGGIAHEAFNAHFGTKLTDEEFRHGFTRAISEKDAGRAARGDERGAESLPARGPGEPGGSGESRPERGESKPAESKPAESKPAEVGTGSEPLWSRAGTSALPAEAGPLSIPGDSQAVKQSVEAGKGEGKSEAKPSLAERLKAKPAAASNEVQKSEVADLPRTSKNILPIKLTQVPDGRWSISGHVNDLQHLRDTVYSSEASARAALSSIGKTPDVVTPYNGPSSEELAKAAREHDAKRAAQTLPERLFSEMSAGRMPKDNIALRKLVSEFDGKPASDARLKEAQEAMEEALVRRAREIVAVEKDPRATFDDLLKLYESQPNLNVRTSTSIENQAYSTPAPLAYLAGKLAGIGKATKVYEPTAGNGMLVIGAEPKNVYANELNGDRKAALTRQGFHVTEEDATNGVPAGVPKVEAVITNPPFGSVKGPDGKPTKVAVDGYKIGQIDHLIAARALDAMNDDGKATLILGANKVAGGMSTADRTFFNWLYSHYNIVAHFELDGKLYSRQGAAWPVRLIVIDGRSRSDRFSPKEGEIGRASNWKEVYERYSDGLEAIQSRDRSDRPGSSVQRPGDAPTEVRSPAAGSAGKPDPARPGAGKAVADRQPRAQPEPLQPGDVESASGLARTDNDVRPDADASRSDRLAKGEPGKPAAKRDAEPAGAGGSSSSLADPEKVFQVEYAPASRKKDKGVLIPTNMRDPLQHAMRALEDRVGDIDEYAAKKLGYESVEDLHDALMGLQVDSVAMAINQIERGKAIIIGDQTGIGKGRQAAAIIRYAELHGKVPVFMSVTPTLFTDMFGDLADIGTDNIRPLILNNDESISLPNNTTVFGNKPASHKANLERLKSSGELPEDRNALFVTYSQVNVANVKREALMAVAHKAIFVLDESHNAAGESQTGEFVQELLDLAHGVVFLSATYAKRPDNMALYARTDIGLAIKDKAKLEAAMALGGLALQTVVSNNLVKAGQNFRRERSYDGVDINEVTAVGRSAKHRALADKVTESLRAIVDADRLFHTVALEHLQKELKGESIASGGNKASQTVQHTEFTAVVHNAVRQLLLGLKADDTVDRAVAAIERGEKPVIAVEQTMGSFLQEYAANNGLQAGDALGDFSYRTVLSRALERSRAVIKTTQTGDKIRIPIAMSRLDDETRAAYNKAQAIIDALVADIPMSPIDWIRQGIKNAGHTIAEITGRKLAVDYSDPKNPKLSAVPTEELSNGGKVETTRRFNDGRLDAILLNVAGATGISLHASEKFSDQRKRRMIVAQPAQDINIFMQMLGRVHRTGQVETPNYDILGVDLPAEKRPNAMLSKKMKSLNANTSSNTESATSVKAQDMLNKYGDEVVAQFLSDNPGLAKALDVEPFGDGGKPKDDIARTATGRLALMPVAVQETFYSEVEQAYDTYIRYLNDTNQNDLEPRTYDFEAKELKSSILSKGSNPESPFGQDSIYGEYSIKAQFKPLTEADVKSAMDKSLDGKTAAAHTQALIDGLQSQYEAWKETLDPALDSTAKAAVARESAINFIKGHSIGSTLRLNVNEDVFSAAVTNIESTHKGTGNPFSMSKINVTLATTGSQPNIKIPATQLMRITVTRVNESPSSLFAYHRPPARETAKIITGNILGAYGEMKDTKGTIINFTREDGTVEQGILLPKKFDMQTNTMGDRLLETPAQVTKFMRGYSKPDEMAVIGVASRDGDVRVVIDKNGKLQIQTPKAKARGGKYFLDKALTDVTGDFVSSGQMMKATIPSGKEKEALAVLMKKTSLYASRSMADEAEKIIAGPPVKSSGTTLHASAFGLDYAAKAVGRLIKPTWDKDVQPHLAALGGSTKEVAALLVNVLAPTINANKDVLDALMTLKGDQERAMFHLDEAFAGIEEMFDELPESEHIEFLDRYKRGEDQKSPELDKVAEMFKTLDTATYKRIVDAQVGAMDRSIRKVWDRMGSNAREAFYDELTTAKSFEQAGDRELMRDMSATVDERKEARERVVLQRIADGVLSFKANHLRAFWKVIPGTLEEKSTQRGRRSPLRGDRGFTKRSTLPDVSSGIADGGVLESTNPMKLIVMGQKSSLRYITAQNMWREIGDLGMRKYVPMLERAPDGWEKIEDSIAKVFYPVHILTDDLSKMPDVVEKSEIGTRSAIVQGGEWYVEQSSARLLNNYLSKNWFDTNAAGRGLMKFKNITTGFELALSPFHAVFESIEAIGSQFGLGLMNSWNNGVRYGDGSAFLQGLGQMGTAAAAPVTMAKMGGKAVTMEKKGFEAFAADPANRSFLERFPDAPHLVDLLFTGGITMAQPREYRVDMMQSAKSALKDGNHLGALARAVPGIASAIMKPMFETWIPRLKMGFALQALAQGLAEQHDAIVRGDVTEAEIARSVVNSTENRFGELNFSNLWWNNTFKGVNQLTFRSVTWKLGNWRGLATGVAGQGKAFADPLKTMRDDARGYRKGADRAAHEYIPKLDLNMSWLIGMAVTTAVLGSIISKLRSGKYPWEWLDEDKDRGMSAPGALVTELTHPRFGGTDEYTGLPNRVSLPTGARDFEHAFADPRGYLHGSLSGFAGKMWDTWDNRDFANNYVYDPNGTAYRKLADILTYNSPANITASQLFKDHKEHDYSSMEMGMMGLSKASTRIDMTPLERHMEDVRRAKKIPQTPEEKKAYQEKMAEVMDGKMSAKERKAALKAFNKPYLERLFKNLNYFEAKKAMELATPDEQRQLRPALLSKRRAALDRGQRGQVLRADRGD